MMGTAVCGLAQPGPTPAQPFTDPALGLGGAGSGHAEIVLDATSKELSVRPGALNCVFEFHVKNTSEANITIYRVRTSCGCTVAKMPSQPWLMAPGTEGILEVVVDLRGKTGVLYKTATIESSVGSQELKLTITIPPPPFMSEAASSEQRLRNQMLATKDRQAVFKGDCAQCHADPASGKMGWDLYLTACAICHNPQRRATMVPDLRALNVSVGRDYWRQWVTYGKPGTLMPAFAVAQGGPLTPSQIDSLLDSLADTISPTNHSPSH